jgi:hypothetical protein
MNKSMELEEDEELGHHGGIDNRQDQVISNLMEIW